MGLAPLPPNTPTQTTSSYHPCFWLRPKRMQFGTNNKTYIGMDTTAFLPLQKVCTRPQMMHESILRMNMGGISVRPDLCNSVSLK